MLTSPHIFRLRSQVVATDAARRFFKPEDLPAAALPVLGVRVDYMCEQYDVPFHCFVCVCVNNMCELLYVDWWSWCKWAACVECCAWTSARGTCGLGCVGPSSGYVELCALT
eukprot:363283-Chlamydomonas_euryale.AAC.10